jgi:hypothetical protein
MTIDDSIRFLEAIFGAFDAEGGVPVGEIEAAEKRLGCALPRALRLLYSRTGRVKSLHTVHNTLVAIGEVDFASDHLIFYEENQAVVVWAIARSRLLEEDPPVDQGQLTDGDWTFYSEFGSVSEFASAQGAWQAVQGGLPFVGQVQQPADARRVDSVAMTRAYGPPSLVTEGMSAWLVDGGVAIDAGDGFIGLATRGAAEFLSASALLGLELVAWDHATLRDDE